MPSCFRSIAIAMPCLIASALIAPVPAAAVWSTDATVNNPVCSLVGDQYFPDMLADGAGGCFLVWMDLRDGTSHLYAQRLDADGVYLARLDAGRQRAVHRMLLLK